MILWNRLIRPLQRRFRRQRANLLLAMFPQIAGGRIVDVGGSLLFWQEVGDILNPSNVQVFNVSDGRMTMAIRSPQPWIDTQLYDGQTLPLADQSVDFVLCNSVIEHVPLTLRQQLANEIRRVGKSYAVQTPSRAFPIELHFLLPFVHWMPRRLARHLVQVSPFKLLAGIDARQYFDDTQLLSAAELTGFFPEARLVTERLLGIPKSLLAVMQGPRPEQPTDADSGRGQRPSRWA